MITFSCSCGQMMKAAEEHAGKTTVCPKCGQRVGIPAAPEAAPPDVVPVVRAAQEAGPAPGRARPPEPADEELDRPRRRRRREEDDYDGDDRPAPKGTSGKAIASLILGLLSFCLPVVSSLAAIILGWLALSDIRKSRGALGGQGLALGGIITGALSLLIVVPIALLVPAVQKVREAAARTQSMNNMKQIGLALHGYNDAYQQMPPQATYGKDGRPLLSWRVALLPFVEQDNLFRQFKMDEPWDSPNNIRLVKQMPPVYTDPRASPEDTAKGLTHYQVFIGPRGTVPQPALGNDLDTLVPFGGPEVFRKSARGGIQTVVDGTSHTIFVAVAARPVPWTKPEDLPYSPQQPLPALGIGGRDFEVVLMDGSVRTIRPSRTSEQTIRAAITRDGGEVLGHDWD